MLQLPICEEALEVADGNGLVIFAPATGYFARVVTDPPADTRKWVSFPLQSQCFGEFSLSYKRHIPVSVYSCGAGERTGSSAGFLNEVSAGDCLGIAPIGGATVGHSQVELTPHLHRADFGAFSAAGAYVKVDVSGFLADGDLEVSRFSFDLIYLSIGYGLYIEVSSRLHQPGGYYAHRTVVCGEGLVELSHHSADVALFLYQVDFEAGVRQVECGLHTADSTSYYQHSANFFLFVTHLSEKSLIFMA